MVVTSSGGRVCTGIPRFVYICHQHISKVDLLCFTATRVLAMEVAHRGTQAARYAKAHDFPIQVTSVDRTQPASPKEIHHVIQHQHNPARNEQS